VREEKRRGKCNVKWAERRGAEARELKDTDR
jgi:hypothetical protein